MSRKLKPQKPEPHRVAVRLTADTEAFLRDQALRYGATVNAEIVRSIRQRMEREAATHA